MAYAKDRRQSKAPGPRPDPGKAADPIIYQPEIKRRLLQIRSQVEGARALAVLAAVNVDVMERATDAEARAAAAATVALLTPIIKAFGSDLGMESTLSAQQVYGGHGYVWDHGMEQLARDCRITQIYEGTNEVQALDLLARKLTGPAGEFADRFLAEQRSTIAELEFDGKLAEVIVPVQAALEQLTATTRWMREHLESDPAAAHGAATPYLRLFALTLIASLWVQLAAASRSQDGAFYATKRKLAEFYVQHVLPETQSLALSITTGSSALAGFEVSDFGG